MLIIDLCFLLCLGHLDVVQTVHRGDYGEKDRIHKERVGCVELMNTVQLRVMPKYHVYGHIHEGECGFAFDLSDCESLFVRKLKTSLLTNLGK